MTLPAEFADLEDLLDTWRTSSQKERVEKRIMSSSEELRQFYDRMSPRLDAILKYLTDKKLDGISDQDKALLELTLSLSEVSIAVENYGAKPTVTDGFDVRRLEIVREPAGV